MAGADQSHRPDGVGLRTQSAIQTPGRPLLRCQLIRPAPAVFHHPVNADGSGVVIRRIMPVQQAGKEGGVKKVDAGHGH